MTLPRWLARLNKAGLNRLTRHVAPVLPWMGLLVHTGRRSGRRYETPVHLFRTPGGFLIALTYGAGHTDWVKNVLAAGGAELRAGGRVYQVGSPLVYRDQSRAGIRPLERQALRALGVTEFLSLTITS